MRLWRCLSVLLVLSACREPTREPAPPVPSALGEFVLPAVPSDVAHPLRINFENRLELAGYDIDPEGALRPGTRIKLKLYWKCLRPLESGWSLFARLIDAGGHEVDVPGLDDASPLRRRPSPDTPQALSPSAWQAGKVYVDALEFELPREVTTNEVSVVAGVGREVDAPMPKDAGAAPLDSDATAPKPTVDYRLRVVSGPSAGVDRGLVTRLAVAGTPLPAAAPAASRNAVPDLKALFRALGK
jgi:hypothetical protein